MQALRIHGFGHPGSGRLEDVPPPVPGPAQVAIRVHAASVNPLDVKLAGGTLQAVFPLRFPYIPGTDVAGVVEATGPGATRWRAGDRVVGRLEPTLGGGFAGQAVLPQDALCAIPPAMGFEQAAALPTAAGTADLALFGVGGLRAGQRVLVHAAAGGVGSIAVQLARQAGAHVVATASAGNAALLAQLGAERTIDYRHEDFTRIEPVDLVVDAVGGDTAERSWRVLREGGLLASLVDFAIADRGGVRGRFVYFQEGTPALARALQLFEAGRLQVVVDGVHPLAQAGAALERVAGGHARGKVIVRMGA